MDGANTSKSYSGIIGNERERLIEPKAQTPCTTCVPACKKRVVNGVAALFFMSLERFSCVNIETQDDSDDANDVPLVHCDASPGQETRVVIRRSIDHGVAGKEN
ncbi:hypothetical protein CK203_089546 [Vitis vinifera]|uniref:Uncharacterized protein n=1 Tax=Vitis vinifera TaxID=29760 RepID=A0A438FBQ4_VITVI|nr:hypothetical protein CK203_089546 [Vitis vinifera]